MAAAAAATCCERRPGAPGAPLATAGGRLIAAAEAGTLKHVALELGGKAAALILDEAPLGRIVEATVPAVTSNNGQPD